MRSLLHASSASMIALVASVVIVRPVGGQQAWEEVARFQAPSGIGRAAVTDGRHVLLQATIFPNAGLPLYSLTGGTWTQVATFTVNTGVFQYYGTATGLDGDWAVMRAETYANEAWLCFFRRTPGGEWVLFQELPEPPDSGSTFAYGMQLDGTTLAVGDYASPYGVYSGVVRVYGFDGSAWVLEQTVTPDLPLANMRFGRFLSVEGDRMVVTAPGDAGGALYVCERQGGVWAEAARIARPQSFHGGPVDLSGDRFVVGLQGDPLQVPAVNGEAYVYERVGGSWVEAADLPDPRLEPGSYYGHSVSMDGDRAVVAAPYPRTGFSGSVFVYERAEGAWGLTRTIVSPNAAATIGQGLSLAGNQLVFTEVFANDVVVYDVVATASPRNGSGANPACYAAAPPLVGSAWTGQVDVSGHPGATLTVVVGGTQPLSGVFVGAGELLSGGATVFTSSAAPSGGLANHAGTIPDDPSLSGLTAFSQAAILGGAGLRLCNAVDLTVGF